MQEGSRKNGATASTRYHTTSWNRISSDRTFQNIDGLLQSSFAESPTLTQFSDSDTKKETIIYYTTEV